MFTAHLGHKAKASSSGRDRGIAPPLSAEQQASAVTYTTADSLFWSREQADIAGKDWTLPQHLVGSSAAVYSDLQL